MNERVSFGLIGAVAACIAVVAALAAHWHTDGWTMSRAGLPGFTIGTMATGEAPHPNDRLRRTGTLVVTSLQSGSEAQREGIAVGDLLLAIDNHRVATLDDAEQTMRGSDANVVALRLAHGSTLRELVLHVNRVERHEP